MASSKGREWRRGRRLSWVAAASRWADRDKESREGVGEEKTDGRTSFTLGDRTHRLDGLGRSAGRAAARGDSPLHADEPSRSALCARVPGSWGRGQGEACTGVCGRGEPGSMASAAGGATGAVAAR